VHLGPTSSLFFSSLFFTMAALRISNTESSFFVVLFLVLFAVRSPLLVLFAAIALFAFFLHKRKEIYFLWSVVAPRINGDAVCTFDLFLLDIVISTLKFTSICRILVFILIIFFCVLISRNLAPAQVPARVR
jgi:hypothetical protein